MKMAKIVITRTRPPLNKTMKKKRKNCSSIMEITKASFDTAVQKKPSAATVTLDDGGGIKPSSWVKSLLLGRGTYGSVYLATSKSGTAERAIKTAEISRASSLMDESRILNRLQSPFVVCCYGEEFAREGNRMNYNLILEYCSGKSVADFIKGNQGGLLESEVKVFARDVLSGLTYIHDRNIIHCDIKPDNLLLCPTDHRFRSNGYLTKIGDFGLAMEKGSLKYGNGHGHKRGTTSYMAPEVISRGIMDFGADVWSFGCTVLEMLSGKPVWGEYGDLSSDDQVNLIGHSDQVPQMPGWLSEEALDFLRRCLERDVHKRWSSHSLKSHPFVLL